jgi:hypothetical protein
LLRVTNTPVPSHDERCALLLQQVALGFDAALFAYLTFQIEHLGGISARALGVDRLPSFNALIDLRTDAERQQHHSYEERSHGAPQYFIGILRTEVIPCKWVGVDAAAKMGDCSVIHEGDPNNMADAKKLALGGLALGGLFDVSLWRRLG